MENRPTYNEREVLRQIAAGSESAFRQLFYKYRPRLIAFVLGLSRSEQSAEDIVHDIFLDLWKNRERLPEIEHFSTYLFRAVQYKAHRQLQRRAKEVLILAELRREEYGEPVAEQQETLSLRAVRDFLKQSLDKLSPQQRKIFLLSREVGLSHAQIAAKLGIQPQTVSNHLSEALRILRDEIDAFYGPLAIALFVLHGLG